MEESSEGAIVPEWLRSSLSLLLTVTAIGLYAYILGMAEVRTYIEGAPVFEENMARAAGLLSGLVGAVVAAGFAQGRPPSATPVSAAHVMGGVARTGWISLQHPPRTRTKFLGLARALGLRVRQGPVARAEDGALPIDIAPSRSLTPVMVVGILYFVVYFVVGAAALVLTITRPAVPEIITNAGWVWLGTLLSSGYAFFGLGSGQ
jgi:hypothetical protein